MLKKSALKEYDSIIREYLNPWVIGGYGMLVVSMLLSVYAYSGMDYKNGPVMEALGNVFVPILSWLIFKEKLSIKDWTSIILTALATFLFMF